MADGQDGERAVAVAAGVDYGLAPDSELELLIRSENTTFCHTDAGSGLRSILRVHRRGYHRLDQIESELDWLAALHNETEIVAPVVLPARDGRRVVTVPVDGVARHVVRFAVIAGAHPDDTALTASDFAELGRITAQLHRHSLGWRRPAGFDRFRWDWEHSLGSRPRWGRWQDSAGVGPDERRTLAAAAALLARRLAEYGQGPDRFGLVHADLRAANLMVDGARTAVIDFDDCGFGWLFYDFATAVSFVEHDPRLPQWQDAWLSGYRGLRDYRAADEDMLASFVLLRRLLLLAWMGTRGHSVESRTRLVSYAVGSCELAEAYLSSASRTVC